MSQDHIERFSIQSTGAKQDFVYDLTDEELKKLNSNSVKEVPVQARLDIINDVVKNDFADKVTMDMLNSKEHIAIALKPEVAAELRQARSRQENASRTRWAFRAPKL